MGKVKVYELKQSYKDREKIVSGTLDELLKYYSYTFEVGYSWDKKINKNPKTIKSFVSNLKKSFDVKEGSCYNRTYIQLM